MTKKVGLVGGGQLALMAAPYAKKLNLELHSLDKVGSPASTVVDNFVDGSIQSKKDIIEFGTSLDVVSIEIEAINVDALKELEASGVEVHPSPRIIELIQDKGTQKQFFAENSIPTSPFRLLKSEADLEENTDFLPAFQKLRKGGYDGKGVHALRSKSDFSNAFTAPSVLEKAVQIEREIAVIVGRSKTGEVITFPPVEMIFDEKLNLIDFLFCPVDLTEEQEEKSKELSTLIANKLELVGILAVELFIDTEGKILVNELAPRAHNSGHHTMEATNVSQFEMHLRAISGLPLISPEIESPALMMNLLGAEGFIGPAFLEGKEQLDALDNVYLHWYNKLETKPGRKMGHVTITKRDKKDAIALAKEIRSWLIVKSK